MSVDSSGVTSNGCKLIDKANEPIRTPGDKSAWSQMSYFERLFWLIFMPVRATICTFTLLLSLVIYFGYMMPFLWAKWLWPRFYWYYEGIIYSWLQAFIGYWGYTAGYDIYEYGDNLKVYCENERVLVLCNHQSTADVPSLITVLQKMGPASRKTLWLMDVMFLWTPFGIVARMHGDHFIKQGKGTREVELKKLKYHLNTVFWDRDRRWVIVFPEGGFMYKRIESSQKYASKHGFPNLLHTTLPRYFAVQSILEEIGPRDEQNDLRIGDKHLSHRSKLERIKDKVDEIREKKFIKETRPPISYILDVTIAYPHMKPLSLATLCLGTREKCDIAIHYKIYDANEVPFHDDDKLRDWMYALYQKKDEMLSNFYENGEFVSGEKGVRVYFPWSKILGHYFVLLSLLYLQYRIYLWLLMTSIRLLFS